MKPGLLIGEDLTMLENTQDPICVSIIVPTHILSPERRVDPLGVERAVNRAKEILHYQYSQNEIAPLFQSIDQLYNRIDFTHNMEGLGLFVSASIKETVSFRFPVKEKIMIGNSFLLGDLLYQAYYARSYMVLLLTGRQTKLYEGFFNTLEEIKDGYFPLEFREEYEYNTPTRGSSYVGNAFVKEFERDKSQMKEIRYENFLRKVDMRLNGYLVNQTPLIVTGTQEDVSSFKSITRHETTAEIYGNYFYIPSQTLGSRCWERIKEVLNRHTRQYIHELEEAPRGHVVNDLGQIWKLAKEGRVRKLLVEKDFSIPGFLLNGDAYDLYLDPPDNFHYILPDVIHSLIKIVQKKGGEVIFVDNDSLKPQRIAVITRY